MSDYLPDGGLASNSSRSLHDKTFGILKKIKRERLQSITLEPNFTWNDFLVPYSRDQLPKDEHGSLTYAAEFIKEQNSFLTETSRLAEIIQSRTSEEFPPHIQINNISDVLQVREWLGNGRYGQVHKVELQACGSQDDAGSSNVFAMKRMSKPAPREVAGGEPRSTVSDFETELGHLRKCKHHHIIRLHASFTDDANFGFIMSPVAQHTLQELLSQYSSNNNILGQARIRKALFHSFGCLIEAVRYLHEELRIRHRDIKPRNILMHDQRILISDVGSAYDFFDQNESTGASRPPGTRKYKAPEVLASASSSESQSHNTKVDIFSLGCVFLEIYTVLCDRTLDEMAEFITQKDSTKFEGELGGWTYASKLKHAEEWLDTVFRPDGLGDGPASLIRSMICSEHSERKSAKELFRDIRTKYPRYIGVCCKTPEREESFMRSAISPTGPAPPRFNRVPMGYSMPRSVTSCGIARRESRPGFPQSPNYGEYSYFPDHPQNGEIKIQENPKSDAWAVTRSIVVTFRKPPHSIEEQWLPAYYVDLTRDGRNITIEWSNCDQLVKERRDIRTVSKKIHCSTSSRNNLRMEVTFDNELDAADFSKLLLKVPCEKSVGLSLPNDRILTVGEHEWRAARQGGIGSHLAYLGQPSSSTQPSRLEPLFVPCKFDFTLPLGEHQRYTKLGSKFFWVPWYRSDKEEKYECPENAVFARAELVTLPEEYLICFEDESTISTAIAPESETEEAVSHSETTKFCNNNLQRFLSTLTSWNLVIIFSAMDVQPEKRNFSFKRRQRPADVLCFRKEQETRVAIRRKDDVEEHTIDWTTGTLVKVDVDTSARKLSLKLESRVMGRMLTLGTVTAADDERASRTDSPRTETETWVVAVANGSGDIFGIINNKRSRQNDERY